jgi:hypothetical protein
MIKFIPHHKFPKKQTNQSPKAQIFDKKDVFLYNWFDKIYFLPNHHEILQKK